MILITAPNLSRTLSVQTFLTTPRLRNVYWVAEIAPTASDRLNFNSKRAMSSSSSETRLSCLSIGLGSVSPAANKADAGPVDARIDPAKNHLEKEVERAASLNIDLSFLLVDFPKKPADEYVAELKRRLSEKQYAAVTIGFGVRGNRDYTDAFERLVNTCIEVDPGVKLGFATWPQDVVASLERVLDLK